MAHYVTTVRTRWRPEVAFAYMADLTNFAEWDPGVRSAEQVVGTGAGPDGEFDVTVAGVGPAPSTTLRYRTVDFDPPREVRVVARSPVLTSEDRITVQPDGDGCLVTYDADLRLAGPLRLADPLLAAAFRRIGDRAAAGLRHRLELPEPADVA